MSRSHSYSQISTAYRCGMLYKYIHVDKLPSNEPASGDMKFGTGIHMGIEAILTGNTAYLELFNLYWDLEKTQNNKYGRFGWSELKDQAEVLLTRFDRLHKKKFVVQEMEQRLYGSIDDIKVEGTPDFIGLYGGKKTVVDFKTSGSRYDKAKIAASEQLYLYSYLAEQSRQFSAEQIVYVVFVKGPQPAIQCLSAPLDKSRTSAVLANIRQQAKDIEYKIANNTFTRNFTNCVGYGQKCSHYAECFPGGSNETD